MLDQCSNGLGCPILCLQLMHLHFKPGILCTVRKFICNMQQSHRLGYMYCAFPLHHVNRDQLHDLALY